MVTPHPVGAPYHIWHVFDRSASLPKFFLQRQSFCSKCSDICYGYAPISRNLQTAVLLHLQVFPILCTQSIRNHFPDLQQVIPRQYRIHNTYFLHWHFPFVFLFVFIFWVFHALHFQLMYQRMIALIPCQTGSQSHYPSCGNFFHTFSPSWSSFYINDASCNAF